MKRSADVEIDVDINFESLVKNKQLLKGLTQCGYAKPSPIQLKAIPLGRLGIDLIAQAKSGTGKTVVFGVITLEAINTKIRLPQAMVVVPTREIAIQIRDVLRHIGQCIDGFKCEAFIGGLSMQEDTQRLMGTQVIVGTPGRLMALLNEKRMDTSHIKLMVLDEADKMMSDTFLPQVQFIFNKLPVNKQCITFSATFHDALLESLSEFMKTPKIVRLIQGVPTLNEVQQYYHHVKIETDHPSQIKVYRAKFEAAAEILGKIPFYQCIIFVNSMGRSVELAQWLTQTGWKSGYINAGLSQEKRLKVMEEMRDFKLRILVCSDLIARGIDIDRVNLVMNIDYPWEIETYLHRVGRAGRYGTSGIAVNLIGPDDLPFLDRLNQEGINTEALPDKVSYSKYIKELSENEKEVLHQHEDDKLNTKPMPSLMKLVSCPKKKEDHIRKTKKTKVTRPTSTSRTHFIPPDLFF